VLVIDHMLQVSEQQSEERLAIRNEDGGHALPKVGVLQAPKSFFDIVPVNSNPRDRLLPRARLVNRQIAQPFKMRQYFRVRDPPIAIILLFSTA